ncbi:MAG: AbrB/MazE/SpoVT family DNA-binding domain-containing protein [Planctomycetes bacterium]|nr:AbrB/MazE/SpoVT family DNA-binding domain-containing protein [Planctomycetota bacterium]
MITQIQKWGNSLGIRIPRSFAKQARVDRGSEVDLAVERGRLVIRPVKPAKYRLEALLGKIRPDNLHTEVDTGSPAGRERL